MKKNSEIVSLGALTIKLKSHDTWTLAVIAAKSTSVFYWHFSAPLPPQASSFFMLVWKVKNQTSSK